MLAQDLPTCGLFSNPALYLYFPYMRRRTPSIRISVPQLSVVRALPHLCLVRLTMGGETRSLLNPRTHCKQKCRERFRL